MLLANDCGLGLGLGLFGATVVTKLIFSPSVLYSVSLIKRNELTIFSKLWASKWNYFSQTWTKQWQTLSVIHNRETKKQQRLRNKESKSCETFTAYTQFLPWVEYFNCQFISRGCLLSIDFLSISNKTQNCWLMACYGSRIWLHLIQQE